METTLSLSSWFQLNSPWVGYAAMAIFGGAISHLQAFEKYQGQWSLKVHVGRLVIAWTYAVFIAIIVYYLGQDYWKLPAPVCFVITGVASVFGSESIRWVYDRGRALLSSKLPGKDFDGK